MVSVFLTVGWHLRSMMEGCLLRAPVSLVFNSLALPYILLQSETSELVFSGRLSPPGLQYWGQSIQRLGKRLVRMQLRTTEAFVVHFLL